MEKINATVLRIDNIEKEPSEIDGDKIIGGARRYLIGKIVRERATRKNRRSSTSFGGNLTAKSATTLSCWSGCTFHISGC